MVEKLDFPIDKESLQRYVNSNEQALSFLQTLWEDLERALKVLMELNAQTLLKLEFLEKLLKAEGESITLPNGSVIPNFSLLRAELERARENSKETLENEITIFREAYSKEFAKNLEQMGGVYKEELEKFRDYRDEVLREFREALERLDKENLRENLEALILYHKKSLQESLYKHTIYHLLDL